MMSHASSNQPAKLIGASVRDDVALSPVHGEHGSDGVEQCSEIRGIPEKGVRPYGVSKRFIAGTA